MNRILSRRELLEIGATGAAAWIAARSAQTGTHLESARPEKEGKRKMHLGLVTYNVAKDWDFDTLLKNCKEAGIEGVEFRTTHAHGVEPSISPDRRREVKRRCAEDGLKQLSLGSVCEFHSPDPEEVRKNIEDCRQFVLLAKDIGARGVKVRPNGLPAGVPAEKTLEQIGKSLAACGRFAADHGVEIWMEVHGGETQLPMNARRIMGYCNNPNVGVTWNSNPTDVANGSVKEAFDLLGPFIRCCHINDLWSDYPYREFFGLLNSAGYDRFTLCEVGASIRAEDGVPFLRCYRGLWKELSR